MALNFKEIDKILEETDLKGAFLQKIRAVDYSSLCLEFYKPGCPLPLYISLKQRSCRLHILTRKLKFHKKPHRFCDFLKSRLKGARISELSQINNNRIIFFKMIRGGEEVHMYLRLWGGHSNIIITDTEGSILETFFRKPEKDEYTGGHFDPEAIKTLPAKKEYSVRDYSAFESFNACVESEFFSDEDREKRDRLIKQVERSLLKREAGLEFAISRTKENIHSYEKSEKWKQTGDLIMSSLHSLKKGMEWAEIFDYYSSRMATIKLKKELNPYDNAQYYYKKHSKAEKGLELAKEKLNNLKNALKQVRSDLEGLSSIDDISTLESMTDSAPVKVKKEEGIPGLQFTSHGFRIYAGRNARENDTLLRRWVRGNDWWLHARDYPGGHIFVKNQKGKSVPLEVLLDAGNLAINYCKAKSSGKGEVYYTQVKYLRRVKNGPPGKVIPTQEKNLSIVLDQERLNRLKGENS